MKPALPPAPRQRPRGAAAAPRVVRWLAAPAAGPNDTPDDRLRHVLLIELALLMSGGGVLWGLLAIVIGATAQSSIPFGYVTLTVLNLALLRLHRNFELTRTAQIAFSLVLPFALQWSLGGMVPSGAMMTWSLLALVGALTVQSAGTTIRWVVLFVLLMVLSVALEPQVRQFTVLVDPWHQTLALALNLSIITPILFGLMLYFVRSAERLTEEIARASVENERLVHRMLPVPVAERLRAGERIIADQIDDATVVFCDIVGFTAWSRDASPIEVVDTLRELFSRFDVATRRHGLEKIKTIGDAYMAAAGVPVAQPDHLERAVALAFEMIEVARELKTPHGASIELRVGLDSGPVVAGVIGQDKVLYDIWGPTVNLASRLEASGLPGTVHVSARTFARLHGRCEADPRGSMTIKGVGEVETVSLRHCASSAAAKVPDDEQAA